MLDPSLVYQNYYLTKDYKILEKAWKTLIGVKISQMEAKSIFFNLMIILGCIGIILIISTISSVSITRIWRAFRAFKRNFTLVARTAAPAPTVNLNV